MNNASSFYPTPLADITEEQWADLLGTNLKAPLFLAKAALPHLKSARGVIINIVDIHAIRPLKDHTMYGAAKAGLGFLTRALARDLAPDVRVNGVAPGAILWPDGGVTDKMRDSVLKQIPLKRVGEPEDIADLRALPRARRALRHWPDHRRGRRSQRGLVSGTDLPAHRPTDRLELQIADPLHRVPALVEVRPHPGHGFPGHRMAQFRRQFRDGPEHKAVLADVFPGHPDRRFRNHG